MIARTTKLTAALYALGGLLTQVDAFLDGCDALRLTARAKTFVPGQSVYDYEVENFWSNHQIMAPACVFRPTSAEDVAAALLINEVTTTEFAVRGGGHMGIRGANSIDGGPLIVMSNLTKLEVAADRKTVWVGPGLDWGEVYSYLGQFGLATTGGRLSPVGVPGLLLGGGINFHGNQHGWSADNVVEYEIVLYTGQVVKVTKNVRSDLFWALKGGSNNFGIVTGFRLNTFPSGDVYAGVYSVTDIPALLEAIANYSAFNTDPLSHMVPQVVAVDEETTVGAVILYYDSDKDPEPECFRPFWDLPNVGNTFSKTTLSQFADETGQLVVPGIYDMFIAGTTVGKTYDDLLEGVQVSWAAFEAELPKLFAILPPADRQLISMDWQPLGDLWLAGSQKANPAGNALGFEPEEKGTYLAWAEVVEWRGEEHSEAVYDWIKTTTWKIANATQAAGVYDAFNYMGDSAGFQEVYDGYGEANKKKLLSISRKYDPLRLLQRLWPGGFKLGL
ncbi:uncharacterized protein J7T54_005051 [Emericellopsis cladophorae]|uniref:FAD-binding PCMH-type domain-containing protein n=1 Tax=Emericellopsis cladophorae TaxID=2686198 RepID=A0A9P9XVD3_9HYPO|nr:uncharacterized protein J7T54_005051 [Emericellopsis cladophorae]KAI6778527.1 hypothetical protein J7T54_005051 [Emericellopsis cladophorae]